MQKPVFESNGYGRNVVADQVLNIPTSSGGTQQMRAGEVANLPKEAFDQICQVSPPSLCQPTSVSKMFHSVRACLHSRLYCAAATSDALLTFYSRRLSHSFDIEPSSGDQAADLVYFKRHFCLAKAGGRITMTVPRLSCSQSRESCQQPCLTSCETWAGCVTFLVVCCRQMGACLSLDSHIMLSSLLRLVACHQSCMVTPMPGGPCPG